MTVHTCPRCSYNTTKSVDMRYHINRKYICEPNLADISLDEFKKTYMKEIFYMCVCEKGFKSRDGYRKHTSKCAAFIPEVKEILYTCVCEKGFASSSGYRKHKLTCSSVIKKTEISASDLVLQKVLVDPEDLELINKYKWAKTKDGYLRGEVDGKPIFMHQLLIGKAPKNMIIDHKNGIKHDNRRINLRFADKKQNGQNRESTKDSTSKYLGVSWDATYKKWIVQSHLDGKNIRLGGFIDENEAAKRYDTFVLLHFGEYARTNELINYEDVKDLNLEEFLGKKKRDLPKFIRKKSNSFEVLIVYKGKKFNKTVPTLELAKEKLIEFQGEIRNIKDAELEEHQKREILRNEEGVAIVSVKNDKGEIIDDFMVDDDRWHDVMRYSWCQGGEYYRARIEDKLYSIHQYIFGEIVPDGMIIDHWDKNPRNNKHANLRLANMSQNGHNRTKRANATTKYYGVSFKDKVYVAFIQKDGKKYHLGSYKEILDAARAYNVKATELYGEFANLNIL